MRSFLVFLAFVVSSAPALAGVATGVFEDAAGSYRVIVTLDDPRGPIGREHFDAISFDSQDASGQNAIQLALTAESIASLPGPKEARVRRAQSDENGEWLIDWSGVQARMEVQLVSSCTSGLAGQFTGIVTLDQSFIVTVYTSMSQLTVLSTLNSKGDADLYIYDTFANLVCSSTRLTSSKISDQCGFLDSTCNQQATSYVEVYGYKKKNLFHVAIWFSNAV